MAEGRPGHGNQPVFDLTAQVRVAIQAYQGHLPRCRGPAPPLDRHPCSHNPRGAVTGATTGNHGRHASGAGAGFFPPATIGDSSPMPYPLRAPMMVVMAQVLVLHGSPGSGKSTLARGLSEVLRTAHVAHGVIDIDELSLVHPYPGRSFPRENLRAIWPNYRATCPDIKLILPMVFADEQEVDLLRDALPGARLIICETAAPIAVLQKRVTEREPTDEWAAALRTWIDVYHARSDHERIRHFRVVTHPATVSESVHEILNQTGWLG